MWAFREGLCLYSLWWVQAQAEDPSRVAPSLRAANFLGHSSLLGRESLTEKHEPVAVSPWYVCSRSSWQILSAPLLSGGTGMKLVCAEALPSIKARVRGAGSCLWVVNMGVGRLNFPIPQRQSQCLLRCPTELCKHETSADLRLKGRICSLLCWASV